MEHVLNYLVRLKRPHQSREECGVVPYLQGELATCGEVAITRTMIDGSGNLHVDMRTEEFHRTLFVAHTDTVHGSGGVNRVVATGTGLYAVNAPLGADDAAGIAILMALIQGGVPGYYIFTRGEEYGGIGSNYLASEWPDLLDEFDRAVAFDRRGTTDVIDHQQGQRCCSEDFADALSDALNERGMMYMPTSGIYTDTAEFTDIIPECTNISCGYYFEHTDKEWLDLTHWRALREAALQIDWDALPTVRKPRSSGNSTYPAGYYLTPDHLPDAFDLDAPDFDDTAPDAPRPWGKPSEH